MKTHVAAVILAITFSLTHFSQDIQLGEVQGRLLNAHHKPIAGAQVLYVRSADGKAYRCTTNAVGMFYMSGLPVGDYKLEVNGPGGETLYSSQKHVFAEDQKSLNILHIDLAVISPRSPLDSRLDFKVPEIQPGSWHKATMTTIPDLTVEERAHLPGNGAAVEFAKLRPDISDAINHQDWRFAAKLLARLIEIAPAKWELYQGLGMAQRHLEEYKGSIASFEKGLELIARESGSRDRAKIKEAMASMFMGEGESYFFLGDMHAAAAQFRQAAEVDTSPALAYIRLCSAEYNGGNDDQAIAACKKAIESDASETRFYQQLAGIQSNLGKNSDAIRTYEKGVVLAQDKFRILNGSVRSNINSKSNAEISGADRYSREIGQMLFGEGNAYFAQRKYKEAAGLFAQAAETQPAPMLAYFNLCASLYDMNDLSGASAACDKAIALDRKFADAYFAKGSVDYAIAFRRKKFIPPPAATLAIKKYLELAPRGIYSDRARAILQEVGVKD
jgi:tetratricopeptide (TPR) repeat protein